MDNINLLPWRETKRAVVNERHTLYVFVIVIGVVLFAITIKCYVFHQMNHQRRINHQLTHKIINLNKKIKPALKWDESHKRLIKKIAIIDETDKHLMVSLCFFDSLASIIPTGIALERIERKLNKITLFGCDESGAHLPQLMRNILHRDEMKLSGIPEIQQSHMLDDTIESKFKITFILADKI